MNHLLLANKTALITGGTNGLGKAIAMSLTRSGAKVVVTHKWGSMDEDVLNQEFIENSLIPPTIIQSDAADDDDIVALINQITADIGSIDIFISNVAFGQIAKDMDDLKLNSLELSIKYSAWPIVRIPQLIHKITGNYPKYIIGVSSDGGVVCHKGYALVGAAKMVLETLIKYMAINLRQHKVVVNAIRPGFLDTASSRATFGDEKIAELKSIMPGIFLDPYEVAHVCTALCSGLMDYVTGQVIHVDGGWPLVSPMQLLLREHDNE